MKANICYSASSKNRNRQRNLTRLAAGVGMNGGKKLHEVFDALAARDGAKCHWCGKPLTVLTATKDHRVPRCKGGANALTNLLLACKRCNHKRGHMSYEQFHTLTKRAKK